MLCEYNKGKLTYKEAMEMNLGFMQYLWYKSMKEAKSRKNKQSELDKAITEEGG